METTSHRPWETTSSPPQNSQTLPSISTLISKSPPTGEKPHPDSAISPHRDSGSWMSHSALTGSSAQSNNTMPFLNSGHSPSGPGPSPFTPDTSIGSTFANAHQQPNGNIDRAPHRQSSDYDESRRSSVAGSIHHGMNNLVLSTTSPYTSNNPSQTSLATGLQQQRGIVQTNGYTPGRYSSLGGPISPFASSRGGRGGFTAGRVAPPILENPKSDVYSADNPTRGQAYAFPDPDARPGKPSSTFSRRNSFAESFTSSILTIESSRLPLGQHELPEAHHHSLVNKQIDSLKGDPDSPNGTTPYSRTPELRVTHKLAERKRRSEMKDCFEQLRSRLPTHQNNKSSKWETLSRAIDYITSLETQIKQDRIDYEKQRHQISDLEMKVQQMNEQLQRFQHQQSYQQPPPNAMPQSPLGYSSGYGNSMDTSTEPSRTLPPLVNGAMQGVQYSDDRRK